MKLLTYTAGNPKSHKEIGQRLRELKPGEYIIQIKRNRPVRSLSQNKFYWALIQIVATDTAHTAKEVDNMFKMDRFFETIEYPGGRTKTIPKDFHNLDTVEFSVVVNNLQQWIRETFPELIIPRKEDLTYAQWLQIQKQYADVNSGF